MRVSYEFICFADDVDIVGRTFQAVAIQYPKTKYLLAGGTGRDRVGISNSVVNHEDVLEMNLYTLDQIWKMEYSKL